MENLAINNEQSVDASQQMGTAVNSGDVGNIGKESDNAYQEKPGGFFKEGNPGKPKGARSFTTKVREALLKVSEDNATTEEQQLIKTIIQVARSGDSAMIRLIWNYLDGMPLQKLGRDSENPLILQLNNVIANKNGLNNTTSRDSESE